MKVGISVFMNTATIGPAELAIEAERLGFESIWLPEHSHIPLEGSQRAGNLAPEYELLYEPFVALAAMSSVTNRIRLGTAVTLLPIRDPLWLAKTVGTLDQIADGRIELGVGYGWLEREITEHGVDFSSRRSRAREYLDVINRMWSSDGVFEYSGEFVKVGPTRIEPKPVQRPRPPIHIGAGLGPRTLRDIVDFADGWIPLGRFSPDAEKIEEVRAAPSDGRQLQVTLYGEYKGRESFEEQRALGCDRVVLKLVASDRDDMLRLMNTVARETLS